MLAAAGLANGVTEIVRAAAEGPDSLTALTVKVCAVFVSGLISR
jgi:hypothetical protein